MPKSTKRNLTTFNKVHKDVDLARASTNVSDLLEYPIQCAHCKRSYQVTKNLSHYLRCSFCRRMKHVLEQTLQKGILKPGSKENDGHRKITVDLSKELL